MKKIKERGITLIALVITIVVLLILAGITIGAITGDNGIINKTGQAKEDTEIANEKEIIDTSTVEAMGRNKRGNLEEDEFQSAIDKHTDGKVEVTDIGEEFEVYFTETNRYYMVDKDGNIGETQEVVKDKSPGDITKDENGNDLKGDENEPYEIWCIEDLVEFSKIMNSTNAYILADKYIKLCKTLNFKSKLSYTDYETTAYDEFLGGDGNTKLIEQLSEDGNGFYPINGGPNKNSNVAKEFDGQGFKLENIYINQEDDAGFIGEAIGINVKNLTISGTIISRNGYAGGISGLLYQNNNVTNVIDNCYNKATIKAKTEAGGILGHGPATIKNSSNYGEIIAEKYAGGISGAGNGINVINCSNLGNVISNGIAGGILGFYNYEVIIYNSYNMGKISAPKYVGGIIGYIYSVAKIKNVYNIGKIESTGGIYGAIIGTALWNNPDNSINYGYYLDNIDKGVGKIIPDTMTKYTKEQMTSQEFINELNENIKNIQTDGIDTSEWCNWVIGEDGYPTFE